MATGDDQELQEGLGRAGGIAGQGSMEKRVNLSVDEASVNKFTRKFKEFASQLEKTDKTMKGFVKTARELKDVWDKTNAPDMSGAGGAGKTDAGGVPSNGNFLSTGAMYGAMSGMMSGMMKGGGWATAAYYGKEAIRAGWSYAGTQLEGNADYSLTADRTGLLMRQMYGGTQLEYQSRWRQPLTGGLIGGSGVEQMMRLQTTMGINPTSMLRGVEGIRVASGFGYSTEDATKMISALAQPGSANLMTMMLGGGLYAPGGKARDPMDVVRNVVQRMGLTNQAMVEGALQPGSMMRSNLSRTGLPEDMQELVIQYAQSNLQYKERGGRGMYDPSNERHRQMMGIDESYAMEEQRTRMTEVQRSEKFYRRQVDNFAQLERNTQGLIEKFQALDEVLSPLIGLRGNLTNKWYLRLLGKIPGVPNLGDSEHLRDAGMNSGFASSLGSLKAAADKDGVPLSLTSGTRDSAKQEMLFRSRHTPVGDVEWAGQTWKLNPGASPAAPPGRSLHELGYAADLGPPSSYEWIMANAAKHGLRHGGSFGEPWHVAPANITSTSQVTGKTARTVTTPRPASSGSNEWLSYLSGLDDVGRAEWATKLGVARDPATRGMSTGDTGGGSSVVISPTINLLGSSNTAADADALANRVVHMIESSEAVRSLRRS